MDKPTLPFGKMKKDTVELMELYDADINTESGRRYTDLWYRATGKTLYLRDLQLVPVYHEVREDTGWASAGSSLGRMLKDLLDSAPANSRLATFDNFQSSGGRIVSEIVNVTFYCDYAQTCVDNTTPTQSA